MKTKILLISFYLFFCADTFAQAKKVTDYIQYDQLYLTWNNHNISFAAIKNTTIIKLLGKPIKITKEKSEVTDLMVVTYYYTNGEVVIENGELVDIDVKKSGWAFTFRYKNAFTKPYTIGSDIKGLIKLFPNSWAHKRDNVFDVFIGKSDDSIVFETDGYKLKSVSLFTNES